MTEETLEKYIDVMNNHELQDRIFVRPLSNTVDMAKVWDRLPTGEHYNEGGYTIYFIKDKENRYVAAVLDMDLQDLHVFVKPKSRKQGHLSRALQEWILPYLFDNGREFQQITYNDEHARRHALQCGFTEIEPGKAVIKPEEIRSQPHLQNENVPLTPEALQEIKRKLYYTAGILQMIKDQLDMAYDESGQYDEAIKLVRKLVWQTEDIGFKYNKSQ